MKRILMIACLFTCFAFVIANDNYDSTNDINRLSYENSKNTINAYRQIVGDVSRDTVFSQYLIDFSTLCINIGENEEAIQAMNEASNIYKEFYGYKSPKYAMSLGNLALYYSINQNYDEAIQLGTEALEIIKTTFGTDHPYYVATLVNLALINSNNDNYDEAIQLGTEALEIQKRTLGSDHPDYIKSLRFLTDLYSKLGNYNKAVTLGTELVNIRKKTLGINNPDYVASLAKLADYYSGTGNNDEAIKLATQAMKIWKDNAGTENPSYATLLFNIAGYYGLNGDYDEAIELDCEALEIRKKLFGTDHPEYASSLEHLALSYGYLSQFDKALQFAAEASEIIKKTFGSDNLMYAHSLNTLSGIYSELGNYLEAIRLETEAKEINKNCFGTSHPAYASSLNELAVSYHKLGNQDEAIRLATEAERITKDVMGTTHSQYANIIANLASFYRELGDYNIAMGLSVKAMDIRKQLLGTCHPTFASSLNQMAFLYYELGNYNEAIRLATDALGIRKQIFGANSPKYSESANIIALSYLEQGYYNEAVRLFLEVKENVQNAYGNEHPEYAIALNNLATCYYCIEDYDEAIKLESEAVGIAKNTLGTKHLNYATDLCNLSVYYSKVGNYTEAIRLSSEANNNIKSSYGINHPDYVNTLGHLANYYYQMGNYIEAFTNIREYIQLSQKAVLNAFSVLTTEERYLFWERYGTEQYNIIPEIIIHSNTPEATSILYNNTALFSKSLLLSTELEMIKLIQESGNNEALQMYSKLRQNRQMLNSLYSKPIAERYLNCDSLERESSDLERQLVSRVKELGDYTRNLSITWKDVQRKLNKNDIAIEFLSYQENDSTTTYAALTLCNNDTVPVLTLLANEPELIDAAGNDKTYLTSMADSLIWRPLLPRLEGKTHVYFSASGLLHNIGIEYLPSMEGKDCHRLSSTRELVTHQHSSSINSATLFGYIDYNATYSSIDSKTDNSAKYSNSPLNINYAQSSEQTRTEVNGSIATNDGNDLLATSDSPSSLEYDIQLPEASKNRGGFDYRSMRYEVDSLPGSRVEVQTISALLDSLDVAYVPLMTNQASEESFKALSGQRKSLIHISTHGFYYDEDEAENKAEHMRMILMGENRPANIEDQSLLRCGLCFAGANQTFKGESQPADGQDDGILNALEIAQTDLRGLDLVVLSACQTALGDVSQGEGVFGLQRGFKKAGAQSILMSLWDVDDEVTQQLMTEFYRDWTSGMTKTSALKSAQSKIKAKYPDPRHWAAFILLDALD